MTNSGGVAARLVDGDDRQVNNEVSNVVHLSEARNGVILAMPAFQAIESNNAGIRDTLMVYSAIDWCCSVKKSFEIQFAKAGQ